MNPNNIGARFAVVIVNYNGGSMLPLCVASAASEGVPQAQIIAVDNGSSDGSIDNFNAATVIRNDCNAGFAKAVNQGIRKALAEPVRPEFILLLNNDAQLETGALAAFANAFDALPMLAIAGGQLRYPDGRLQSAFAPLPSVAEEILPRSFLQLFFSDRFRRKTIGDNPFAVECVLGACLCVRAAFLEHLGLLDENYFFFFEEIEWCQRAGHIGLDVYFLPQARALHRQGATADRFRGPSRVEYQRSKLIYFKKTQSITDYRIVSTVLVIRTLVNALAGALMCAATLFLNRRVRTRTFTYWYVLCWLLLLRPASWGLPGKCGRTRNGVSADGPA